MITVIAVCIIILALIAVLVFKELIDTKGQLVGLCFMIIGLAAFSYWALIGRKK